MPPLLVALLIALSLAACGGSAPAPESGRGILVVAVDAWRFDHTSFDAYDRDTTPRLVALAAEEGIVFHDAWTPGSGLKPAHVALLTGCDPGVARRPKVVLSDGRVQPPATDWYIPEEVPSLAAEFAAEGWNTAAFIDHRFLEERHGFERGFRRFEEVGGGRGQDWVPLLVGVGMRFFTWVEKLDAREDWFAYVHLNDLEALWDWRWERFGPALKPHFEPRPELDFVLPTGSRGPLFHALPPERKLEGSPTLAEYEVRYDTALSWIDQNLVRLITRLRSVTSAERTTIVLVGSFGIGFGEAGLYVTSGSMSEADLHVPLLVFPARDLELEVGRRSDALVSLVDLAPTLLELYGVQVPAGMHGRSLTAELRGRSPVIREELFASYGVADGFAVVTPDWHFTSWRPGTRGAASTLTRSWFGDRRAHRDVVLRSLIDRREGERAPWPSPTIADEAVAAELERRGREWFADLNRARLVLHPSGGTEEDRTPEVVEELREKGLIGGR